MNYASNIYMAGGYWQGYFNYLLQRTSRIAFCS